MVSEPAPLPTATIADRARREIELLTREIGEIELLVQQARTEAARHEQKRSQLAERLKTLPGRDEPSETSELNEQLLSLTRRSTMMEAQVDVLEGKLKVLTRFRESLRRYSTDLDRTVAVAQVPERAEPSEVILPAAVSRVVQAAQEDLRREIARAMHDGPAQSLTNIVLQVQIVERLLERDPRAARSELDALVAMVQQTLDATKAFIFDVRPMVLDDLGLVPTLRRVARDRGRRSHIPIEFESIGPDRRLPMEVETTLFRIIDETVSGFLSSRPDRISIRIDWSDQIEVGVAARREAGEAPPEPPEPEHRVSERRGTPERELPAALRAMIEEQRAGARAARQAQPLGLPPRTWREIQQGADAVGAMAELRNDGRELVLVLPDEK